MRRRATAVGACLLLVALLVVLAVRHVRGVHQIGTFGLPITSVLLYAGGVAVLAALAALLDRAHRRGLPNRVVQALLAACALLGVALLLGAGQVHFRELGEDGSGFLSRGLDLRDLVHELPWGRGAVAVAALGLLPVAGVVAWRGDRRAPVPTAARGALLVVSALAAALLLRELERSVALLDVLRGDAQQLGPREQVVWVSALWALVALALSARALRSSDVPRLAVLLPPAVLLAWGALLLEDAPRHACCFTYAPPGEYVPPPVLPDLLLLGGCLIVGVGLPLALQRLRVRSRASTPPG